MKYELIKTINPNYSALEQILTNRGILYEEIYHYTHTTDEDINSYLLFGEDNLKQAATVLFEAIKDNMKTALIVDSDDDGFTSSAILLNYLHNSFPQWVENNISIYFHQGKQHGLEDCLDWILRNHFQLVLCPDSASNDYFCHQEIKNQGGEIIILDHHEAEFVSPNAIVINNQLSDYPNKSLSGAGIVWQFCRYLDSLADTHYSNNFLDLVALGLVGDMMSLRSIETKHLINKGFQPKNIKNPFIYYIWDKNQYKLGEHITAWGAAFYIVPFVNAIMRSGSPEEKQLVFESMLDYKAFEKVPSTKRGHKIGEMEQKVQQAMRVCTNVKVRQTKAQDDGLKTLEHKIKDENLLDNQVLLFLLDSNELDKNIAGLVANKIMGKYQRPCCVLIKTQNSYQGSARGCNKVGVTTFKDICSSTNDVLYAEGHQGAFGLGIKEDKISSFINDTNQILKDMPNEVIYYVDYIYKGEKINLQNILDIARMNEYWGQDVDEPLIAIEGLNITEPMVQLLSPDKNPTLRISLLNGKMSLIKFNSSQEEYEHFITNGYIKINAIGHCSINEWNDQITPQIIIEDYDIAKVSKYFF